MDCGLAIGVAVSLLTLFWRNQHAYACVLGEIPNTSIYVDAQRFSGAVEIPNHKIFHFGAGLHFANKDYFRKVLLQLTGLDPLKWNADVMKAAKSQKKPKESRLRRISKRISEGFPKRNECFTGCCTCSDSDSDVADNKLTVPVIAVEQPNEEPEGPENIYEIREVKLDKRAFSGSAGAGDSLALPTSTGLTVRRRSFKVDAKDHRLPFKYLLIDLSAISFIDIAGMKLLKSLIQDYERICIKVLFAGATEPALKMFRRMNFMEEIPAHRFFPTVYDAVVSSKFRIRGGSSRQGRLEAVSEVEERLLERTEGEVQN